MFDKYCIYNFVVFLMTFILWFVDIVELSKILKNPHEFHLVVHIKGVTMSPFPLLGFLHCLG